MGERGRRAAGVLEILAQTENRVVRPQDFRGTYVNPWAEFARMVGTGVLEKVAHGYYLLVPDRHRGRAWRPEVHAIALGIAVADYGRDAVALTGPAAARALGVLPRALAVATVVTPKQRPVIRTDFGQVRFVKRRAQKLERQRVETDVVAGWTTTPEQTAIDIADRPMLGGITPVTAAEILRGLARQANIAHIEVLARSQRKHGAWQRFCWVVDLPAPTELRYGVPTRGLANPERHPADYGLVERAA